MGVYIKLCLVAISCYKHVYMLLPCSYAFISSLFIKELVKTPFRMHHFAGSLKIIWVAMTRIHLVSHHAFGACSAHPTTSHIILLMGNTVIVSSINIALWYRLTMYCVACVLYVCIYKPFIISINKAHHRIPSGYSISCFISPNKT